MVFARKVRSPDKLNWRKEGYKIDVAYKMPSTGWTFRPKTNVSESKKFL